MVRPHTTTVRVVHPLSTVLRALYVCTVVHYDTSGRKEIK